MFSSRVINASNTFMAMLRVLIVFEVIWSRLLKLASCPNTREPPTFGHLNVSAAAGNAVSRLMARMIARINKPSFPRVPIFATGLAQRQALPLC